MFEKTLPQPQRLLKEVSIVLSGVEHKPPGEVRPWLQHGGMAALNAQKKGKRRAAEIVVGVGGPDVPNAIKSTALAGLRDHREKQERRADEAELKVRKRGGDAAAVKAARAKFSETVRACELFLLGGVKGRTCRAIP